MSIEFNLQCQSPPNLINVNTFLTKGCVCASPAGTEGSVKWPSTAQYSATPGPDEMWIVVLLHSGI